MNRVKVVIISLFLSQFFLQAEDNLFNKSFEGREWEFLQYKFQDRLSHKDILKALGISLAVAAGSICSVIQLFEIEPTGKNPEFVVTAGLGLGLFTLFNRLAHYDRQAKVNRAINFIKKWPDNKKYSPAYFYSAFDELFALYQQEGETKAFKSKILQFIWIIDRAIENRTVHIVYR